jgi:hypothetical protein
MEKSSKIILTDWAAARQNVKGNPRGMETDDLLELYKSLYHGMMRYETKEVLGLLVSVSAIDVKKELEYRKVLPTLSELEKTGGCI